MSHCSLSRLPVSKERLFGALSGSVRVVLRHAGRKDVGQDLSWQLFKHGFDPE